MPKITASANGTPPCPKPMIDTKAAKRVIPHSFDSSAWVQVSFPNLSMLKR